MITMRRIPRLFGVSAAAFLCAHLGSAQTLHPLHPVAATTRPPAAYGTSEYTVTTISALSFSGVTYLPTGPLSRLSALGVEQHFYATLDIPAGALIDYIGINNFSPPNGIQDFSDVPTTHQFYQFIQALYYSGITAGCGGGKFCPDQALTRGEMAVFLATALGLNWPN